MLIISLKDFFTFNKERFFFNPDLIAFGIKVHFVFIVEIALTGCTYLVAILIEVDSLFGIKECGPGIADFLVSRTLNLN